MAEYVETKVADWFAAYQRGERLPEHTLPGEGINRPAQQEPDNSIIEQED